MKKIFYYIAVSVFFIGCEEYMDITIDGNKEKKLVVEGLITTDTTAHKIVLSRSDDFFNKAEKLMETGAEVTITDGSGIFLLHETSPGIYLTDSDFYGEIGKTYTLNIKLSDTTEYTATETIYPLPEIDSILLRYDTTYQDGIDVLYYGNETAGLGDCYLWSLYVNNVLNTDTLFENVFTDDQFVDGKYINDFELFYIPSDELPTEKDTLNFKVEMYSISDKYYDYIVGLMLETAWKGSPWDGPASNSIGNISNGALGYFGASAVKRAENEIILER